MNAKKSLLFFLSSFLLLTACTDSLKEKKAKGGKIYGGTFSYVAQPISSSIFPLKSVRPSAQRVVAMLFEPLLKVTTGSKIEPCLARKYSVSDDGKKVVLVIRKDVYFHEDACFDGELEKMSVEDVKFSLEFACSANPLNQMQNVLGGKIVGSDSFYKKSKKTFPKEGISGIKILNDSTLTIELIKPYVHFLTLLTHPNLVVFSKKAFDYYGQKIELHPLGTGPFCFKSWSKEKVIFSRNNEYWRKDKFGNQLPFLGEICVYTNNIVKNEAHLFASGKTDLLMELPVDQLENAFGTLRDAQNGKNVLHRTLFQKGVKMNFISFNCKTKPFNDARVRKAFQLALNRQQLIDDVLNGDGDLSNNGVVPKSELYNSKNVKSFAFDVAKARSLLAEAGYPNGKGFPTINLCVTTSQTSIVQSYCKQCVKQLNKNLGLHMKTVCYRVQKRNELIKKGIVKCWKTGWTADYPDPEAYLSFFYSHYRNNNNDMWSINSFSNKQFDALFEQMQIEKNASKRLALQNACDQLIIDEAACIPLFSQDIFVLANIRVRDINVSRSGIIDLSNTYLKSVE